MIYCKLYIIWHFNFKWIKICQNISLVTKWKFVGFEICHRFLKRKIKLHKENNNFLLFLNSFFVLFIYCEMNKRSEIDSEKRWRKISVYNFLASSSIVADMLWLLLLLSLILFAFVRFYFIFFMIIIYLSITLYEHP